MQEPASVLFSILNLGGHFYGWKRYMSRISPHYHLKPLYAALGIFSMNCWTWSAVFHSRDFPFTEKMGIFLVILLDYFSAMAALLVGLQLAIHRVFHLKFQSALSQLLMIFSFIFFLLRNLRTNFQIFHTFHFTNLTMSTILLLE